MYLLPWIWAFFILQIAAICFLLGLVVGHTKATRPIKPLMQFHELSKDHQHDEWSRQFHAQVAESKKNNEKVQEKQQKPL